MRDVAALEKSYLGSGAGGRNTRSNHRTSEGVARSQSHGRCRSRKSIQSGGSPFPVALGFPRVAGNALDLLGVPLRKPERERDDFRKVAFAIAFSSGNFTAGSARLLLSTPRLEAWFVRSLRASGSFAAIALILASADPSSAASLIGTTTVNDAFSSGSRFFTHCANGYYWVAYHNGTEPVLYSSPDAAVWTLRGPIFSSFDPGPLGEWAVRFSGTNIIAFGYNSGNTQRYYRNGTLNGTGTVTWNAADAATGGASWPPLNALIANGKPILWRADATADGAFRIGSQLNGPTWINTVNAPPLTTGLPVSGSAGGFSAGAIFQTGGTDPDDVIVLRTTTAAALTPNSHRLVAVKYDASLGTFDPNWYNVSTLGGTLTEDATTEVRVQADDSAHARFAAVRDTSGNIHAVYANRNLRLVHYKKDVGLNDFWSRISTDVTGVGTAKVALSAAPNNNLYLFYVSGLLVYHRRFDGTSWGPPTLLYDATGSDINDTLAPMESVNGCPVGLAFSEGFGPPPHNIRFTLLTDTCGELQTAEGAGTVTIVSPASYEMRFNTATGGGVDRFYDLALDPGGSYDLAGSAAASLHESLLVDEFLSGGNWYTNERVAPNRQKLDLLEATSTRVKLRSEDFYGDWPGGVILPGIKAFGDYSVYPSGRMALRWNRRATSDVPYSSNDLIDLVVHYQGGAPLNSWSSWAESGNTFPTATGGDNFILEQIDQTQVKTDFLVIPSQDYPAADQVDRQAGLAEEELQLWWRDSTATTIPAGTSDVHNYLTYFKPTSFINNVDAQVTGRSNDYRTPSALTIGVGSPWSDTSENTGAGDDYNESEAAYVLQFDMAAGLSFDINGTSPNRYHPFFKIRNWRSLADPQTVTVGGVTKVNDLDYKADVKPISRAYFAYASDGPDEAGIIWYSTLESSGAVTSPSVGSAGAVTAGVTPSADRFGVGSGLRVPTTADSISFPLANNFDKAAGAIEFWFRPAYDSTDGVQHMIAGFFVNATSAFALEKGWSNNLYFKISTTASDSQLEVLAADYSWRANEWVHIRIQWNDSAPLATQQRLFLNGIEPVHGDPGLDYDSSLLTATGSFYIGRINDGAPPFSEGTYDELYSYVGSSSTSPPTLLAAGGLTTNTSEYLASTSRNFTFDFGNVDGSRRGEYFYLGADSKFRGLNVDLATSGIGTVNLQWQYWNGTAWGNLEGVAGFTDETNNLTRRGTIFWTTDPGGWSLYSLNGGPDLFFVRAYLASGAYTTQPRESVIKTDILLFQYCGDVTAAETFVFPVPPTTEVTLSSFSAQGLDSAVEISWETASELNNLGFHLYRADSEEGPYERITASAIPGLGSSPAGARYRYLDSGLTNGKTYSYHLEDIETTGKTERHGPVSATPTLGAGEETSSSSSSTITYGDSPGSSLQVLDRSESELVLELRTEGFEAEVEEDGSVRLSIPGFEVTTAPGSPALPMKRSWVEVEPGRGVRVASARAEEVEVFSLRPSAADSPEVVASRRGTVRAGRRREREGASFRGAGLYPEEAARISAVGYQGEVKKALLELWPLRWDGGSQELLFSRRLVVRLVFSEGEERTHRERESHRRGAAPVRLVARDEGLYGVRFEEAMGGRPLAESQLRLSRQEEPVAFHLEPDNGVFRPGSTLYFRSEGAALNPYGDEAVYELSRRAGGAVMERGSAKPRGSRVSFYLDRVEREENRYYQAALLEAEDLWLWDLLFAPVEKSYSFQLSGIGESSAPSRLSMWLQGVSDFAVSPDHHVRVKVNGVEVAETSFDGKEPLRLEAEFSTGLLGEGENTLSVENVGDTGATYSMVMLDRFEVEYPRQLVADGRVEGEFSEIGEAEIAGLSFGAHVLDVTEERSRWLTGAEATAQGLRLGVEAGRSYLVVNADSVKKPEVRMPSRSGLKSQRNRADYLMVGPRELLDVAAPLLELRRSQGLVSRVAALEEIYSEFGHGESRPEALREFLSYAFHHWRKPAVRYVLLLGDATYDFKDYLGTGVKNRLPPFMVRTSYLWTASDPGYGAVNGEDILPDLAVGRLPAASAEELRGMVKKIISYEANGFLSRGAVVLVADNPDAAGDFEREADEIAVTQLTSRNPRRIYLGRLGVEPTRQAIVEAFDAGASLVSYAGHGGIHLWASENILNSAQVNTFAPQSERPLVLTLNCLNGYFHFPYFNSLAEELLKAEGKGAIATVSPSGLSLDEPAQVFHKALLGELLSGTHARLGDAVLAAQAAYAETGAFPELLTIYHLLGDPALAIR